jgi:mannose-6-phosphate isomerase-like protein (cupin superfamily)
MEKIKEKEKEFRNGDWGIKYLCRGPRIDWGILLLPPTEKMGEHAHRQVEETFYFVSGSGKIIIDNKELPAQEGDAFRLEPGERHDILNDSQDMLKVIFIKCPYLPEDKIRY